MRRDLSEDVWMRLLFVSLSSDKATEAHADRQLKYHRMMQNEKDLRHWNYCLRSFPYRISHPDPLSRVEQIHEWLDGLGKRDVDWANEVDPQAAECDFSVWYFFKDRNDALRFRMKWV